MIELLPTPEAPPSSLTIRVRPSRLWLVLTTMLALGLGAVLAWSGLAVWQEDGPVFRAIMIIAGAFLVLGTLDYAQRIYEFRQDQVRWRILFVWRSKRLPFNVWVQESPYGEVFIHRAAESTLLFRVAKDFNRQSRLFEELKKLYVRGRPAA